MKQPLIEHVIGAEELKPVILDLPLSGKLQQTIDGYSYVNIDDDYIHRTFPLLNKYNVSLPNYFSGIHAIGAHITVIYPEEKINIELSENADEITFSFTIGGVFSAQILNKKYYALEVYSPEIIAFRKKYGLEKILSFKGHAINLHITVAVKSLFSHSDNRRP